MWLLETKQPQQQDCYDTCSIRENYWEVIGVAGVGVRLGTSKRGARGQQGDSVFGRSVVCR